MKLMTGLAFLLLSLTCFSQTGISGFSAVNANQRKDDVTSPDTLAYLLTSSCTTEMEKVRSIFYWITDNISYNTIRFQPQPVAYTDDGFESMHDADSVLQPLDDRVAEVVLKRRYALCDGYARLFKSLCDHAGIKSVVIAGYARTNFGSNQFRCNHKWNAVMIDSKWFLLDATWASGYLSFSDNTFIKNYNDAYFLTPPKYFINDHYPDDIKWTLLEDPPELPEFKHSPFKQPDFNYRIVSYWPAKGIINANVGDTINIALQTTDDKKELYLLDKPSVDSVDIALADSCFKVKKTCAVKADKVSMEYIVTNENAQWLQVVYNSKIILRYKLNIKKEPFNYPAIIIKDIPVNN